MASQEEEYSKESGTAGAKKESLPLRLRNVLEDLVPSGTSSASFDVSPAEPSSAVLPAQRPLSVHEKHQILDDIDLLLDEMEQSSSEHTGSVAGARDATVRPDAIVPREKELQSEPHLVDHPDRSSAQLPEKSQVFPEESQVFPEESQEFPEKSQEFPEKSQEFPEKSQEFPEESQEFPEKSQVPTQDTTGRILPEELSEPAPEPDPLRFDLFQQRAAVRTGIHSPGELAYFLQHGAVPAIEKPGVLLRRVDMQMTSDLTPVPRVVPAEEILNQQPPLSLPEPDPEIPEGQQRFAEFDEPAPQGLPEEELRLRLEQSREARTSQFRHLRSLGEKLEESGETSIPPKTAAPEPTLHRPPFEYKERKDRDGVFRALCAIRTQQAHATVLLLLLFVFAEVLQLLPVFFSQVFSPASHLLSGLLAVCLVSSCCALARRFYTGIQGLFQRRPTADTLLLLAAVVCVVQTVLLFFPATMGDGVSVTPLFLLSGLLLQTARWMSARQDCVNFRFCAYRDNDTLYALRTVEEESLMTRQQKILGRRGLCLPAPVPFPQDFVRASFVPNAIDQNSALFVVIGGILAAAAALFAFRRSEEPAAVATAAAVMLCLAVPAISLVSLAWMTRVQCRKGKAQGVAILNTDGAERCANAGTYALDAQDLFLPEKGKMHGWREYWQVRTDDVLLYAAGIAIASGGPLQAVFDGVVEGDYSVLPQIQDLQFEDRMGLSCWIHNQKVFFGNRHLMENHGISVGLTDREERRYEHDGRKIVYLALEKQLTAFFVVSYAPDPALQALFPMLAREDMEALIYNEDPAVTQDSLTAAFGMTSGRGMTLLHALQGNRCRQLRYLWDAPEDSAPIGIYHGNSALAFLRAQLACITLRDGIRWLRVTHVLGLAVSFGLLLLSILTRRQMEAGGFVFVAFTGIWGTLTVAVAKNVSSRSSTTATRHTRARKKHPKK